MNANSLICISIAALAGVSSPLPAAETEETCNARNLVNGMCRPYIFDAKTRVCLSSCRMPIVYRPNAPSSIPGGGSGATGGGSSEHRAPKVARFVVEQTDMQPQFQFETKEQMAVRKALNPYGTTLSIPAASISTRLGKGR